MTPNIRIAIRFLTAKKRSMLMSLSCIILGVGLFIVTQAATSGFQSKFIRTILGTDGAVRIEDRGQNTMQTITAGAYNSGFEIEDYGTKYVEGIDYPQQLERTLRTFRNVDGISEVLRGTNVTIRSPFKDDTVQVYGIDVNNHRRVSDLGSQIVAGSLLAFSTSADGAMLGQDMADRMHLSIRDPFELITASGQTRHYVVRAIYQTGVEDIDRVRVYLNMEQARSLLEKPTGISYLQVSLHDSSRADHDAGWMSHVLGYRVAAWQYREKTWLQVFDMLRVSTGITVSVFTLIAGLAMFNTLAMVVLEKTKDIAILRSMGYTRRDISMIFLWQAVIVLTIGCLIGCALGAAVTYAVSQVPLQIRGIFTTNKLLVEWSKWHYIEAVATAVVMVMAASLVPSRRAARLEPGDIIRGTAQ